MPKKTLEKRLKDIEKEGLAKVFEGYLKETSPEKELFDKVKDFNGLGKGLIEIFRGDIYNAAVAHLEKVKPHEKKDETEAFVGVLEAIVLNSMKTLKVATHFAETYEAAVKKGAISMEERKEALSGWAKNYLGIDANRLRMLASLKSHEEIKEQLIQMVDQFAEDHYQLHKQNLLNKTLGYGNERPKREALFAAYLVKKNKEQGYEPEKLGKHLMNMFEPLSVYEQLIRSKDREKRFTKSSGMKPYTPPKEEYKKAA